MVNLARRYVRFQIGQKNTFFFILFALNFHPEIFSPKRNNPRQRVHI